MILNRIVYSFIHHFKSCISSADYSIDPIPPSFPMCCIPYNGGVQFDLHCNGDNIHLPSGYQLDNTVKFLSTNLFGIIKNMSIHGNDTQYLVKYITSGEFVESRT